MLWNYNSNISNCFFICCWTISWCQRTGWGWWSPKVTYHVFTYTTTAPAQTTDYAVCAVNAEGTASEAVTATLTVKPTTWWNWWF